MYSVPQRTLWERCCLSKNFSASWWTIGANKVEIQFSTGWAYFDHQCTPVHPFYNDASVFMCQINPYLCIIRGCVLGLMKYCVSISGSLYSYSLKITGKTSQSACYRDRLPEHPQALFSWRKTDQFPSRGIFHIARQSKLLFVFVWASKANLRIVWVGRDLFCSRIIHPGGIDPIPAPCCGQSLAWSHSRDELSEQCLCFWPWCEHLSQWHHGTLNIPHCSLCFLLLRAPWGRVCWFLGLC